MNTAVISKQEILKTNRELIQSKGWSAVNIRCVAAACGVSVGSIYNYFGSKAELVSATVESVWSEIFSGADEGNAFSDTISCVKWMYSRLEYGCKQYPGFFTLHSLGFMQQDKTDGKKRMQQAWRHILFGLCAVLKNDKNVREDAFTQSFTAEKFAEVLFSLMLSALLRQEYNPDAVLEMVRRVLY